MPSVRTALDLFSRTDSDDFTIGVEEEFFLVDATTGSLVTEADRVVERSDPEPGQAVDHELKRSQIETCTSVCRDGDDLRASIAGLRADVDRSAQRRGARLLASGTHPFAHWRDDGGVHPEPGYVRLQRTYAQLTTEQMVCGCHVHVGISDPELVIAVMNRARAWIPLLVAASANSPFWLGDDTGYASYRTEVFGRWPTAGAPEHLADRAAYERLVDDLQRTGSIDSPARIYWHIRPSARYPTLEFRACDALTSVDETVALALVIRAIAETCHRDAVIGAPFTVPRPELLRSAVWRAARSGLDATLIDLDAMEEVPARVLVGRALDRLRPALEERGDWEAVDETFRRLVHVGTGASRQRAIFGRAGDLRALVDTLVSESTSTS
jgi:carboxylate-amine ligase